MDDKFIYYLVLGAIYLASRLLKKKKPTAPTPQQSYNDDQSETYQSPEIERPSVPKPSSFEELLKEISQEFEQRKEPKPVAQVIEPVAEPIPVAPKVELTREQKYVYKKQAEAKERREAVSLLQLAEQAEEHEPHPVLELLNEEGGAANAVVLSEIMNRRF